MVHHLMSKELYLMSFQNPNKSMRLHIRVFLPIVLYLFAA